jgi:hypothetical protein
MVEKIIPAMGDKLLMEFLMHQMMAAPSAPVARKRNKTSSKILDPAVSAKPEIDLGYIIEKKPKAKKVIEFLQKEVNAIMEEAEG